jgi:hypothetical protein
MMTPKIPSNGLFDSSDGATPARPFAICAGGGKRKALVETAIICSNQRLVRTVAMTERPGRKIVAVFGSSKAIFTGILCTTFVKLPVELSGGRSANCEPLAGAISTILP